MPKIFIYTNTKCVKCHTIEEEMIRVGAIIICHKCFREEFKTKDPVTLERDNYLKWLHIQVDNK